MLPYYDVVLSPLGFSTQAMAIRDAFVKGDYEAMVNVVTDDMVAALAFAGTKDDIRAQARQFEGLYDRLILGAPFFGVGPDENSGQSQRLVGSLSS